MIVITGIGIISALGFDSGSNLDSLTQGLSGVEKVKYLPTVNRDYHIGEVKASNGQLRAMSGLPVEKPELRTAMLGIIAAKEAIGNARLDKASLNFAGFANGTTVGGMDFTETQFPNPGCYRYNSCGTCSEIIAEAISAGGPRVTLSTACSSGANAIAYASDSLNSGEADIFIAGGTEAMSLFHFNGFRSLMIVDKERCRPFSSDRNGINLGEGAAYIVMETLESAKKRGVRPLAVFSGYGNACDAYHPTATSPEAIGPAMAMKEALANAGLTSGEISYISAHGTGTENNDKTEREAMKAVFGDNVPPFSSTKALTGHTTSAAGALQAVFAVMSLSQGFMPGQGFEAVADGDSICPLNGTLKIRPKHILCNSFGFGGNDTSLIISGYEG